MEELKRYSNKDLVLSINETYDPNKLNLDEWDNYLDILCGDRYYQKQAILKSVIYLSFYTPFCLSLFYSL